MIEKIYFIGWLVATASLVYQTKVKAKKITVGDFLLCILFGGLSWFMVFGLVMSNIITHAMKTKWYDKKLF